MSAVPPNSLAGITAVTTGIEGLGLRTPGAKFIAILQSNTLADRLIERFGLMAVYGTKRLSAARERLAQNTTIVEDRRTGIITISVRDHEKRRAKDLAQAYTEELNRLNAELNTSSAHQQRVFLEQRVQEIKAQMDKTANELASFSSKAAIFSPDQGKAETDSAEKLEGQLVVLQTTLSGLLQRYTDKNIKIQEVKAQIAFVQGQLQEMRGSQSAANSTTNALFPSLSELPHLQSTYAGMLRDSKTLSLIYEVVGQQLELAKIEEVKELPTLAVLDPPELADLRLSPNRKLIMAIFTLVGLLAGLGYIVVRDHYQTMGFTSIFGYVGAAILRMVRISETEGSKHEQS